ncbi:Spore germination protein [compost metagenome]
MIEIIKLGTTLERLDMLFVSFWVCTIYIKMTLFLFGAFHCLTETFRIKSSKSVLLGLNLVIMMTAFVSFHDETVFDNQTQHITPYELLAINVGLPLLLVVALLIRKKAPRKRRS